MNTIVTKKERDEMPYIVYGKDVKVKVVDFDKVSQAILKSRKDAGMSNVVELNAIKIYKNKELSDTISWSKDHSTGIYYGIPIGFHVDGNVKWRKILLQEYNTFNLKNPDEMQKWIVCRMHPHVKGSPFESADPKFYVYDADEEASMKFSKATLVSKSINAAQKMATKRILNFHRFLDLPTPEEVSPKRIRNEIVAFAMENPEEFNNKFNSPGREYYEIYSAAKHLGVIIYSPENGFSFKGTFLGHTDIEVIRFLEEDTVTLTAVKNRVTELDNEQAQFTDKKEDKK